MSKPNKCLPHLRLVVDRVADYVGRHHHGLNSMDLLRVDIYARQNKKDRAATLKYLEDAGILALTPLGKGEVWVRHTKHQVNPPQIIVKPARVIVAPVVESETESKPIEDKPRMSSIENMSPEAMRNLAAALEKQAAEKERLGLDRAVFNKALQPLVANLVKAHGMASRKLDEYIDAMAELGKAVDRLREFKGE